MGKPYFEVFPTLKLDKSLHDLLEQTTVERVSATSRKDFLRIYISSERLIRKREIWQVQEEIKKQLFSGVNITVMIYERFILSPQYSPARLMDVYRESILEELKEYSHILYIMFKNSEISYPEQEHIVLTAPDTVPARSMEQELIRVLEKIFNERCGFSVSVTVEYAEGSGDGAADEDEQKIALQVAEISARVRDSRENAAAGNAGAGTGAGPGGTGEKRKARQESKTVAAYQRKAEFGGGQKTQTERGGRGNRAACRTVR
ncbi:MAG: hypothetical protein HDR26_06335 [Lachnospiraceae bacterium]|nr:hypothetical protein [Lachnospiraceae bacterium]